LSGSAHRAGRRWTRLLAILAVVGCGPLAFAACGDDSGGGLEGGGDDVEVQTATAEGDASGDLTISNWALYIDKETVPDFEDETGISVKYVEDINAYDEYYAKMRPLLSGGDSGGRSLMVAGDWLAKQMYDQGYLQKLDHEALAPAFENLSPAVKPPPNDPNWDYSIPWQGGMTGLIVNKKLAPEIDSISDIFDPQYHGRIEVISELRETPALVMKSEGIDPETATTQQWLDAIQKVRDAADSGQIRKFTGGDYARDLTSGNAVAVIGWAADAIQLKADNPDLDWVMPEEGCLVWWDEWVVPVGAPNPTAAYEWINYTYEPENQAQIVGWTSATTPANGVREIFEESDPEQAKNPLIFPTAEYTKNCSGVTSPPGTQEEQQQVADAWVDAMSG
jgi:spermidine/putrescine transport system substrate-binding protein